MKRFTFLVASLALVAAACAPSAPLPPLPEAGCYPVSVPGGWGTVYFTGVAPTPSDPYNFRSYAYDSGCTPGAQTSQASGVNAANAVDAFGKCLEQAGIVTYPDVTAATYYRLPSGFGSIWMCFPI